MSASINSVTLVVRDYDEAISFFTQSLRFSLIEDKPMGNGKRWVRVAPSGSSGATLLLAKAATPPQQNCIGNQTGGRVFLFLETSSFQEDYQFMLSQGVRFLEKPRHEEYGWVVQFLDLYDNKWDLLQYNPS